MSPKRPVYGLIVNGQVDCSESSTPAPTSRGRRSGHATGDLLEPALLIKAADCLLLRVLDVKQLVQVGDFEDLHDIG